MYNICKDLRNKNSILIYLYLYEHGCVEVDEIKKIFRISDMAFEKVCSKLHENGYIDIRLDDMAIMYLTIDLKRFTDDLNACNSCKYLFKQKYSMGNKNYVISDCKMDTCKFKHYLNLKNKIKIAKKTTIQTKLLSNNKKHTKYDKTEKVIKHIKKMYKLHFNGLKFKTNIDLLKRDISKFLFIVKDFTNGKNTVDIYNKYISQVFNNAEDVKSFKMFNLFSFEKFKKFCIKNSIKKLKLKMCKKYRIKCSYYDGKCTLKHDGLKCTKKIREIMLRKYGEDE